MCLLQTNINQSIQAIWPPLRTFFHLLYRTELLTTLPLIPLPFVWIAINTTCCLHQALGEVSPSTLLQVVNELATHLRENRIDDASLLWKLMSVW